PRAITAFDLRCAPSREGVGAMEPFPRRPHHLRDPDLALQPGALQRDLSRLLRRGFVLALASEQAPLAGQRAARPRGAAEAPIPADRGSDLRPGVGAFRRNPTDGPEGPRAPGVTCRCRRPDAPDERTDVQRGLLQLP